MSEREELIKRLQSHLRQLAPHVQERETGRLLTDCLSALSAQQSQEPVARVTYSNWNGVNIEALQAGRCLPVGTELYTAPQSGVREGMMRAAEICKGILVECIKNQKERGDHAVIAMCREAITRAADQVNEAIEDEREACARISDRWENSTISDEIRERNLT